MERSRPGVQEYDSLRGRHRKRRARRTGFGVAIAKKKIPARFLRVITRRLARVGENELAGGLETGIRLPVAHQRLLVVALAPAHIIGITDPASSNRLSARHRRVFAAATYKQPRVRRASRHQRIERFLGSPRGCRGGKLAFVIVGVDLQRDVSLLKVLLTSGQGLLPLVLGGRTPVKRSEDENEGNHDQQFYQGESTQANTGHPSAKRRRTRSES